MERVVVVKHLSDDYEVDDHEPRDTYNIAYIIHFLLGLGNLLPWNTLITAIDYFGYLYPTEHIDKVFSIAYMGSSLPILILLMSWGRWCDKSMISFRFKMNLGLCMFVLVLAIPSIMDWSGFCSTRGSYSVLVAAVVVCGLADGLIGGTLIGSAGKLPERYMQAVFAGTASSGVLVSLLRIITKASLPQTPKGLQTSAHIYFLVSILILLGCFICSNLLHKLPNIQYYMEKRKVIFTPPTTNIIKEPIQIWGVTKRIKFSAFGILLVYLVTLSIFPGFITENVVSNTLKDWYPILLITTYNVSDLVGKSLTSVYVPKCIGKASWACVIRLLLFYPLFTACLHGPRWFRSEIPVIILTCLLGISNGFLTSVLMILAPKSVSMAEAEIAGVVMALFLGFGLFGGSVLGWFWII